MVKNWNKTEKFKPDKESGKMTDNFSVAAMKSYTRIWSGN